MSLFKKRPPIILAEDDYTPYADSKTKSSIAMSEVELEVVRAEVTCQEFEKDKTT